MATIRGRYKPTTSLQALIIRSELELAAFHYVEELQRSPQCGGPGCLLCELGMIAELRANFVVSFGLAGELRVLELRARHMPIICELQELGSPVGVKLWVCKSEERANAPVEVTLGKPQKNGTHGPLERVEISPVRAENYLRAIGRRLYAQICLRPDLEQICAAEQKEGLQNAHTGDLKPLPLPEYLAGNGHAGAAILG
jgi:hypothetical protein